MRVSKAKIAALQRDEFERLRRAYESGSGPHHRNYAALMEALRCAEHANSCPAWMAEAVLSVMVTEINEGVGAVGRWSAQHRRDLVDLVRADTIGTARAQGFTWEEACAFTGEIGQQLMWCARQVSNLRPPV